VVNSQGEISLPRRHGHYQRQKELLENEDVIFYKEKIDMNRYAWRSTKRRNK
jgi:alkylated DNA nucleotide flippase Atl1